VPLRRNLAEVRAAFTRARLKVLEYHNASSRTRVQCLRCGYEWEPLASNIIYRQQRGCPRCDGHYQPLYGAAALAKARRGDTRKRIACRRYGVLLISIPYWKRDVAEFVKQKLRDRC
jgi:hypothetical protein